MQERQKTGMLLGLVGLVFGSALGGDFVWDDRALTLANPAHLNGFWAAVSQPFLVDGSGMAAYWRPVVTGALWLQVQLFGADPFGYHLVNLALHGAVVCLVFGWLLRRTAVGAWPAFFGAALFAIHPSRPESVAWIAGSTDLWMALFVLLALRSWDLRKGMRGAIVSGVFLSLALWSKETAIVVLPLMFVDHWGELKGSKRFQKQLAVIVALVGIALIFRLSQGGMGGGGDSWGTRGFLALSALGHYAELLLWPFEPSVQVGTRMLDASGAEVFAPEYWVGGTLFLLALVGAGLYSSTRDRSGFVARDLLWFVLPLLPVLHLIPLGTVWIAGCRYLYLPLLGVASLVTRFLGTRGESVPWRWTCAGVLLLLSGVSALHTANFASDQDLWRHEAGLHPTSAIAWENLGQAYYRSGEEDTAALLWEKGLERVKSADRRGLGVLGLLVQRERSASTPSPDSAALEAASGFYGGLLAGNAVELESGRGPLEIRLSDVPGGRWNPERFLIPATLAFRRAGQVERAVKNARETVERRPGSQMAWAEAIRLEAIQGNWNAVGEVLSQARAKLGSPQWGAEWMGRVKQSRAMSAMPLPPGTPKDMGEKLVRARVLSALGGHALAWRIMESCGPQADQYESVWTTRVQLEIAENAYERALQWVQGAREKGVGAEAMWKSYEGQIRQALSKASR